MRRRRIDERMTHTIRTPKVWGQFLPVFRPPRARPSQPYFPADEVSDIYLFFSPGFNHLQSVFGRGEQLLATVYNLVHWIHIHNERDSDLSGPQELGARLHV